MKKIIILLISLILIGCSFKSDYFCLNVGDYSFTVGYDNVEYLKAAFDFEIKEELEPYEEIKDIELYLFDKLFCKVDVINKTDKIIDSNKAIINKLTLFVLDIEDRQILIDGLSLSKSVSQTCDDNNGTLIKRNGVACVIEKTTPSNDLNVVELYGDYLNLDQDELDHIVIYTK